MCLGISLSRAELPLELITRDGLDRRTHQRGGEKEIHFLFRDRDPRLPIWKDGQLQIVRWGNNRGHSRVLPTTGWTWQETIDAGGWKNIDATPVDIPASLGFERGVWFRIRQGIRGLLVSNEREEPVVYMICEPSTHYYRVMTRSARMPVLIDERI